MTETTGENHDQMMMRMLMETMRTNQNKGPGFLTGVLTTLLTLGVGVGGTAAYFLLQEDRSQSEIAATAPTATSSGFVPQTIAPEPAFAPAPTFPNGPVTETAALTAQPAPTLGGESNARIAQSENGQIYAYEPTSGLAFQFVVGGGAPRQIRPDQLPADIRGRLLASTGAPAPMAVDPNALASQAERAQAALTAAATTDRRRPPINSLLQSDPDSVQQIVTGLNRSQGIIRAADAAEGQDPTIFAFFDPRCPYCHAAYQGLDGEFTIKWIPVSVFGPEGEENHAYIMGDTLRGTEELNGQSLPTATFAGDAGERSARLDEYMAADFGEYNVPSGVELDETQAMILAENAELFRILSRGAEELRAVPSFFIAGEDGRAVWLQGYDVDNPERDNELIRDIIAGEAS